MNLLEQAHALLEKENATCVILSSEKSIVSKERGVTPILSLLEQGQGDLKDSVCADKVIGKAAAMLLVLGGIRAVYGAIMTVHAMAVFEKWNIPYGYDKKVDFIVNRAGDGMCPMEQVVLHEDDLEKGMELVKNKQLELRRKG